MARQRWTTDHDAILRARHAAGDSLTSIAKHLGFGPGTVSRHAATLGLVWSTAKTAAATEHRRENLKARRTDLVDRLYRRAEHTLSRLEAPAFRTLVSTAPGVDTPTDLTFVPPQDEKALVQAIGTVLTSAARLEQIDGGPGDAVRSMLADLGAALGLTPPAPPAADQQP